MRAVIAPMMADRSFYQAIPGLLEALRLACFVSRVQGFDIKTWLDSREAPTAATESGAKALGFGCRLGRPAKGYVASTSRLCVRLARSVPPHQVMRSRVRAAWAQTESGKAMAAARPAASLNVERRDTSGIAFSLGSAEAAVVACRIYRSRFSWPATGN